jgi:hypothetical protein
MLSETSSHPTVLDLIPAGLASAPALAPTSVLTWVSCNRLAGGGLADKVFQREAGLSQAGQNQNRKAIKTTKSKRGLARLKHDG